MPDLPDKLEPDALAEALCEIRFDSEESAQLPELVVGRLAGRDKWRKFDKQRLPLSEMPAQLRASDLNLKFMPLLELKDQASVRIIKIGPNVVSYHALAPYPGWERLEQEMHQLVDHLFDTVTGPKIIRLGLRYVNIFTPEQHGIAKVSDLNYQVLLDGNPLETPQVLVFQKSHGENHVVQVRVASPQFVTGNVAKSISALVDVDVATPETCRIQNASEVKEWLGQAHIFEKTEFFAILQEDTINRLKV